MVRRCSSVFDYEHFLHFSYRNIIPLPRVLCWSISLCSPSQVVQDSLFCSRKEYISPLEIARRERVCLGTSLPCYQSSFPKWLMGFVPSSCYLLFLSFLPRDDHRNEGSMQRLHFLQDTAFFWLIVLIYSGMFRSSCAVFLEHGLILFYNVLFSHHPRSSFWLMLRVSQLLILSYRYDFG